MPLGRVGLAAVLSVALLGLLQPCPCSGEGLLADGHCGCGPSLRSPGAGCCCGSMGAGQATAMLGSVSSVTGIVPCLDLQVSSSVRVTGSPARCRGVYRRMAPPILRI